MTSGFAAVCLLLTVIGGRLVQLQGFDGASYADAAKAQRVDTTVLNALRGQIVDRAGTVLAYTTDAQDITADPTQVSADERDSYARQLAPLVGQTPQTIVKALEQPGKYALLAQAVSPLAASKVEKLGLVGIYTAATTQRQYPATTTAANVVGLVHSDGTGAAGIEYTYNAQLAGKNGSQTYTTDRNGNLNPNGPSVKASAQNGGTVTLTLDENLQYVAQQYLDQAVSESGARGAEVAILSAKTAQVLALASSGTYNS
ncbi:MAG: penicillin-binding protein 2, partial [Actinobacteria bacterium]|nr:penicillin-binding protein 2 [Actinomycetota bacterium]